MTGHIRLLALALILGVLCVGCGSNTVKVERKEGSDPFAQMGMEMPRPSVYYIDRKTKLFHTAECEVTKKMRKPEHRAPQMAAMMGYKPCPECLPDAQSAPAFSE